MFTLQHGQIYPPVCNNHKLQNSAHHPNSTAVLIQVSSIGRPWPTSVIMWTKCRSMSGGSVSSDCIWRPHNDLTALPFSILWTYMAVKGSYLRRNKCLKCSVKRYRHWSERIIRFGGRTAMRLWIVCLTKMLSSRWSCLSWRKARPSESRHWPRRINICVTISRAMNLNKSGTVLTI